MSFSNDPIFDPLPHVIPYDDDAAFHDESALAGDAAGDLGGDAGEMEFIARSKYLWAPLLVPIGLCGISFACGGIQFLTDLGFGSLTLICLICLLIEIWRFPQRCGIAGILLFGGVLVWFCHDYMTNWFFHSADSLSSYADMPALLARTAFFYSVFVLFMAVGLQLPAWNKLEKRLASIPEPASPNMYLILVLMMLAGGWSAFIFTSELPPISIMKAAFGPWMHDTVHWTVSRTGNYNTNWGGYVGNLLEVGMMGAIIAAMYAVFIAPNLPTRLLGWAIWCYWLLYAYTNGRRGTMAFVALPPLAFLYLKYQTKMLSYGRRHNVKGYVVVGALGILLLLVIQIQGTFRGQGLGEDVDFSKVELTKSQGNLMFSEALPGFYAIPAEVPFFCNRFPGEGAVRAIPETLFWFCLGPIPRALWEDKPSDDAMIWYNKMVGGTNGREGVTISQGLVGHWYFRYGFFGLIEGGMLIGWLMAVSERMLYSANGRPMTILAAFCLAAWLFRVYRNFYFIELYGPLLSIFIFVIITKICNNFAEPQSAEP